MNEVGSLYVSIKADMSSLTGSLAGLSGISSQVGKNMGVNISGGFNNALQTALLSVFTFRNKIKTETDIIKKSFSTITEGLNISKVEKDLNNLLT